MIAKLLCPGLLDTGPVTDKVMAVRDGLVNFYICRTSKGLVCIDTGWRSDGVSRGFEALGLNMRDVATILLTHLHWDHARSLPLFPDAEVFLGERETSSYLASSLIRTRPLKRVQGGQTLSIDGLAVRVLDTPGHSPGSVSYLLDHGLLFTGDALALKSGRIIPFPSFFNDDSKTLAQSIRGLAELDGVKCLFTAHHGITGNTDDAFASWRRPVANPSQRGAMP